MHKAIKSIVNLFARIFPNTNCKIELNKFEDIMNSRNFKNILRTFFTQKISFYLYDNLIDKVRLIQSLKINL